MKALLVDLAATLLGFADALLNVYMWLIVAAVVVSWVNADPHNPIVRFVRNVTEPVLAPLRRRFWRLTVKLSVDLSPLAAILAIELLRVVLRHLRLMLYTL